ncbi:MAG: hypothetical protein AAF515_06630 [Pseudomonadota bacterium]
MSSRLYLVGLLAVLAIAWRYRELALWDAESLLGYALGLGAALCVVLLLVYPLRKRMRWLARLGPTPKWFRAHMLFGVTAPALALLHCNFTLGSFNSRLALLSVLLVAGSGLVGRVLYRGVNQQLRDKRAELRRLRDALAKSGAGRSVSFLRELGDQLRGVDERLLGKHSSLSASVRCLFELPRRLPQERKALLDEAWRLLNERDRKQRFAGRHKRAVFQSLEDYIDAHCLRLAALVRAQLFERLFALWHVIHLPFFVLLVLTLIVHVLAVQLY